MMSDSEDDYMSDKLLQNCEKDDIRPGLIFNNSQKRDHEIFKKKIKTNPKPIKQVEKEVREQGLQTAISSENKGFMLLQKMGYQAGSSLGKSNSGLIQPIPIEVKIGNKGLGHKSILEEKKRKKVEDHVVTAQKFRAYKTEINELKLLKRDLYKAQKACEDLDSRNEKKLPDKEHYWTKEALIELNKKKKEESEESDDTSSEENEEVEDTRQVLEEKLFDLIMYLRNSYFYCIYCGARATDDDDFKSFCPGVTRSDHDDEL